MVCDFSRPAFVLFSVLHLPNTGRSMYNRHHDTAGEDYQYNEDESRNGNAPTPVLIQAIFVIWAPGVSLVL